MTNLTHFFLLQSGKMTTKITTSIVTKFDKQPAMLQQIFQLKGLAWIFSKRSHNSPLQLGCREATVAAPQVVS